jgi:protein-tyrosine phosphatase
VIDIHTHILPGVDDGADALETAVAMCHEAAARGTTAVVLTPHQNHDHWPNLDTARLMQRFETLQTQVGDIVELHLGGEIAVSSDLLDMLELPDRGGLNTLSATRWLLLEFPPIPVGPSPRDIVHEVVTMGFKPLLAHVERIPMLSEDLESLATLVDLGARTQITADSLSGAWGPRAQRRSTDVLSAGLAHVVASDTHNLTRRPPRLDLGRDWIEQNIGSDTAESLVTSNPRAILNDAPVKEVTAPEWK